jgi:hypothetical protein
MSQANSIAFFAFKTAIVLDYASQRNGSPFYEREMRHWFRENLSLPENTRMWFCGYAGNRGGGRLKTAYYNGKLSPTNAFQMHVCTCAFGHFAFQVASVKGNIEAAEFGPRDSFESLAVPFWPQLPWGFIWPASDVLRSKAQFYAFSDRWKSITVFK